MRRKTTISLDDAEKYSYSHMIAAAHGGGENKVLQSIVMGRDIYFEVWSHKKIVMSSPKLDDAVMTYNEL